MTMLAKVCLNCGKVCPANAKTCPVCHHPLPEQAQPQVKAVAFAKTHNSKWFRIIALVALVLGTVIFVHLCHEYTVSQSFHRYEGLVVRDYDRTGKLTHQWCYIVKGAPFYKHSTAQFKLAYIGNQESVLENKGSVKFKQLYHRHHHYQLRLNQHQATLTGPQRFSVPINGRALLGDDITGLNWPERRLKVHFTDSTIMKVRFDRVVPNTTV